MSDANYPACLAHVLKWEGGFVNHPKDPGGATNHGITRATLARHRGHSVSVEDVRRLSVREAGEIYRQTYWAPVRGPDLVPGIDLVAFDAGANSGPARGRKWLQKGLRVKADGVIGPKTMAVANVAGPAEIRRACAARMGFLQGLRNWRTFGRGWSRRVADTEATAVAMNTRSRQAVQDGARIATTAKRAEATAATAAGTGGASAPGLSDLPQWAGEAVLGVAIALAVLLAWRAVHHARRAAAYRAKIEEMSQ